MTWESGPGTFDDSILVTIDSDDESDSEPSGLEFYERCVEKKLSTDTDPGRIATVRETMQRLLSRTNPPDRNLEDYDLIVRYLLRGRLD